MYAVQPLRYHPGEAHWRSSQHCIIEPLPSAAKNWLLDSGSLTKRLITASHGNFKVQVLNQRWQQPRLSEAILLDMRPRERAIIREVALLCHGQAWVFARSVIPATSLTGRLRRLRKFNDSSLGAMLFSDPSMRRRPFQIASIDGNSQQLPAQFRQAQSLWGRRCRFELADKPIMVSEIFLPTCAL
ncbi:chorismate lyase [Oceanicoccus sp. KOV_DT_Chl]|uniref:chorismate--pyruvate lyase family protein n=1 Tax=Oceanicoccus sp. KOV_DT_Chl TaxID=1904639 RepID=UPI000C79EA1C|nr:chorismate lyase [Oceanicoccus sp. KOV_DT_Chl]